MLGGGGEVRVDLGVVSGRTEGVRMIKPHCMYTSNS